MAQEKQEKTDELTPEKISEPGSDQPLAQTPEPEDGANESVKEKIIGIITKMNPDADVSSQGSFLEAVLSSLSQLSFIHDRLYEVVEEFPQFGDAMDGILKGMDPEEAIARYFDTESLAPPEGAPDFEKINIAKTERRQKIDAMNTRKKQLEGNQQVSVDNVKKFMDSKGWDQEKTISFLDKIEELQADFFDGKLSESHLSILEKGFGYDDMVTQKDAEIEAATEDGRIAGLNEQIMKKRAGKETGDGLPRMSNTGGMNTKKGQAVNLVNNELPSKKLKFK